MIIENTIIKNNYYEISKKKNYKVSKSIVTFRITFELNIPSKQLGMMSNLNRSSHLYLLGLFLSVCIGTCCIRTNCFYTPRCSQLFGTFAENVRYYLCVCFTNYHYECISDVLIQSMGLFRYFRRSLPIIIRELHVDRYFTCVPNQGIVVLCNKQFFVLSIRG